MTRKRLFAGAAVATLALAGAWAIFAAGSTYRVNATFEQVNGLVEGADVEVAGSRVGEVTSISLGDSGYPVVAMDIEDDYELREGAVASIRAPSASGQVNRFVELVNPAGEAPELEDGATLGLTATSQPVEADQILSTLDPATRRRIAGTLEGLDAATSGRGDELAGTMKHLAEALGGTADLAEQLDADGESIRTLVEEGGQVVATLADGRDRLGATADRLGTVLRATAGRQAELETSLADLPGALAQARGALDNLRGQVPTLRGLVADARPGVAELVAFSRELRPTIAAARPAIADASGLVREAPSRLADLGPLLDAAEPSLTTLRPTLESAGPILDEARVRTPDFFSFFANWADFTSLYDANGHAARVGIVLPPAPNNVIDGTSNEAGTLAEPFIRTPGVLEGDPWLDYRDSYIGGDDE